MHDGGPHGLEIGEVTSWVKILLSAGVEKPFKSTRTVLMEGPGQQLPREEGVQGCLPSLIRHLNKHFPVLLGCIRLNEFEGQKKSLNLHVGYCRVQKVGSLKGSY